jgi:CubicO group peptidase (beta-lactamase class C family)
MTFTLKKQAHFLVAYFLGFIFHNSFAESLEFPNGDWTEKNPSEVNVSEKKVKTLFDLSFADSATQAVVLIKDGYLIGERYAEEFDASSFGTSWSMAKSFYAALIGISIDRGEIKSLDDKVGLYLDYFNDGRSEVTIRDLLIMSSGLEYPENQHENMFFLYDQLDYAQQIGMDKEPGSLFEYNNVNSILLGDILQKVTGKRADELMVERIFNKIGINEFTLWKDGAGNVLTYCCIDMSARDFSKFGLLFSRNGNWDGEEIISKDFVDETFIQVWDTPQWWTDSERGYSLHWWVSKNDEEGSIFNASGKWGQYIFVDRKNDIIFTRITKYYPTSGSVQNWGLFNRYNKIKDVDRLVNLLQFYIDNNLLDLSKDIESPLTLDDGYSEEFYESYGEIIDSIANLSRD